MNERAPSRRVPCFAVAPPMLFAFNRCRLRAAATTSAPTSATTSTTTSPAKRAAPRAAPRATPPTSRAPHCPLISDKLVRHCVRSAKRRRSHALPQSAQLLRRARASMHRTWRPSARSQLLFLRALTADPWHARTYLLFALFAQRGSGGGDDDDDDEDAAALVRELFRLGVQTHRRDARLLTAWGLFESKQGRLQRARSLIRYGVRLDARIAPVLRWKRIFPRQ